MTSTRFPKFAILPKFVQFATRHAQPDHHAVVQLGATVADRQRQPGNRLAVGFG
jgi:hypothetical protein